MTSLCGPYGPYSLADQGRLARGARDRLATCVVVGLSGLEAKQGMDGWTGLGLTGAWSSSPDFAVTTTYKNQ